MGEVRTEITLVNIEDQGVANRGYIPQDQVRRLTVNAVVDTGAGTETKGLLVIDKETREKLGLRIRRTNMGTLAAGTKGEYAMAGPLEVLWKDRVAVCEAIVLPKTQEILLGAIPLEAMDLVVHPLKQEVVGAHGDQPLHILY
jgi:clan AA aspartic protease